MENAIIIYVDVLGGKNLISENPSIFFANCQDIFCETTKTLHEVIKSQEKTKIKNFTFSDNICIAINVEDHNIFFKRLQLGLNYVGILQRYALMMYGYVLRGGITFGGIYFDDKLISGEPLVEAVNLEEKVAFYPRIILGDSILKKLSEEQTSELKLNNLLLLDNDFCFMVDYIGQLIRDIGMEKNDKKQLVGCTMLEHIAARIISRLNKYSQNIAVRSKWTWLAKYFMNCTMQKIDEIKFQWNSTKLCATCHENLLKLVEELERRDTGI